MSVLQKRKFSYGFLNFWTFGVQGICKICSLWNTFCWVCGKHTKTRSCLIFPYCHHSWSWRFKINVKYCKTFKKMVKVDSTGWIPSESKVALHLFSQTIASNRQCSDRTAVFCEVSNSPILWGYKQHHSFLRRCIPGMFITTRSRNSAKQRHNGFCSYHSSTALTHYCRDIPDSGHWLLKPRYDAVFSWIFWRLTVA